jgi:hypothetical protein
MYASDSELLQALLRATEHYNADPRYAFDGSFITFINASGLKPALLDAAGDWDVRASDIDDLAEDGMLRLLPHDGGGIERHFALTSAGRQRARASLEQLPDPDAVDLSWPMLHARLTAVVDAYERAGAPVQGIVLDEGSRTAAHLRALVSAGYLGETEFGSDQATFLRPTERALNVTRAWPSALSMARGIVEDVVARLEAQPDESARSLKAGLTSGGRDLLVEVLAAVIAKQSGFAE